MRVEFSNELHWINVDDSRSINGMELRDAARMMSALGMEGRLEIVRLLLQTGPRGMSVKDIGAAVESKPSALSSNLRVLVDSGLAEVHRAKDGDGRQRHYRVRLERVHQLVAYLVEACGASARTSTEVLELVRKSGRSD